MQLTASDEDYKGLIFDEKKVLEEDGIKYEVEKCVMTIEQPAKESAARKVNGANSEEFVYLADYYEQYKHRMYLHPTVRALFSKIGVRQRTASWFRIRRGKVTASQVCAVFNDKSFKGQEIYRFRSAFKSRKQLVRSKLGEFRFDDNHILKYGRDNERRAVACAIQRGVPILHEVHENGEIDAIDFGLLQHPEHTFLAGSPDGVTSNGYVVEIKCPWSEEKKKKIKAGYVPDCYYLQMQILMEIMGLRGAYFIQYAPETIIQDETLAVTLVPRNKTLFNKIILPEVSKFFTDLMLKMKTNSSTTVMKDPSLTTIDSPSRKRKREAAKARVQQREEIEKKRLKFHYTLVEGSNMLLKSHQALRNEIVSYKLIEVQEKDGVVSTTHAEKDESDEENFGVM